MKSAGSCGEGASDRLCLQQGGEASWSGNCPSETRTRSSLDRGVERVSGGERQVRGLEVRW